MAGTDVTNLVMFGRNVVLSDQTIQRTLTVIKTVSPTIDQRLKKHYKPSGGVLGAETHPADQDNLTADNKSQIV